MSQVSASFRTSGKSTSISHNNRTVAEEKKFDKYHSHIDWAKTDENIILKQESIKKMYDDLFGEAVENYNAKQKRSDRKIKDYYAKVKNDGSLDLQREFIVQFGDKDLAENEIERKAFTHQLIKYYQTFEHKYPDLKIYNAVVHLDEATPHLHMNVIPVAENYKQGVLKRPSFSKWLKENNLSFQDFRNQNLEIMEELIQEMGAERKLVGTHDYERPAQYRETMRKAEKVLECSKDQANQIISEANKERYELSKDIREELTEAFFVELETVFEEVSEIPDEEMTLTSNYVGGNLDDDAQLDLQKFKPREFLSNFFTDIKKYIKQQFEKIKAKEESLFAREEKVTQREQELEETISKFTKTVNLVNETPELYFKTEPDKETLGAVDRLEKISPGLTGNKSIKSDLAKKITNGFKGLRETIEIQRKYIQHLELENKRLKEPDKYMTFEDRIEKSKQKEMSKGINKSRGFDSQERGRSV